MNRKTLFGSVVLSCLILVSCQSSKSPTTTNNYTNDSSTTYDLQYGLQANTGVIDTFVSDASPDFTYPSGTATITMSDSPNNKIALLNFDLSMIPQGKTVSSCQLCMSLYNSAGAAPVALNIYKIVAAWSPATVTFNNIAPQTIYHSTISVIPDYNLRCYDIQNLMPQEWVTNPAGNFGIAIGISSTAAVSVDLTSSDSTDETHRPELIVTVK